MRITYETTIDASPERVWEILNDFGKGVALYERVTDVSKNRSMHVDVYETEGMPSVVRSMNARFDLTPVGSGTRVSCSLD